MYVNTYINPTYFNMGDLYMYANTYIDTTCFDC